MANLKNNTNDLTERWRLRRDEDGELGFAPLSNSNYVRPEIEAMTPGQLQAAYSKACVLLEQSKLKQAEHSSRRLDMSLTSFEKLREEYSDEYRVALRIKKELELQHRKLKLKSAISKAESGVFSLEANTSGENGKTIEELHLAIAKRNTTINQLRAENGALRQQSGVDDGSLIPDIGVMRRENKELIRRIAGLEAQLSESLAANDQLKSQNKTLKQKLTESGAITAEKDQQKQALLDQLAEGFKLNTLETKFLSFYKARDWGALLGMLAKHMKKIERDPATEFES